MKKLENKFETKKVYTGQLLYIIRNNGNSEDRHNKSILGVFTTPQEAKEAVEVAKTLCQQDVFLGDLIQEGNLGVVVGVGMLADLKTADEVICGQIRQSMQLLLDEQAELLSRDKKMVEKVQALDESIQTLTEELGRKVTIDELAVYMGLEVEEIEDILKLAGEDTEEEAE